MAVPWPSGLPARIAGVNTFGSDGSNAHLVLQDAASYLQRDTTRSRHRYIPSRVLDNGDGVADDDDNDDDGDKSSCSSAGRLYVLIFSGEDKGLLSANCAELKRHMLYVLVRMSLRDIAYMPQPPRPPRLSRQPGPALRRVSHSSG